MYSLNARLLISVSLLLLLFFGATIIVLDTAFRTAGERAREDILDGHLMSLFAVADVTPSGSLEMRRELPEPRFSALGSGHPKVPGYDPVLQALVPGRWLVEAALLPRSSK